MEHVTDLLPGYALGCLDDDELLFVARHLPQCASCREELSSYLLVVDQLPLSVPLQTPPPVLKGKILRRVEGRVGGQKTGNSQPARLRAASGGFWAGLFARPLAAMVAVLALLLVSLLAISNFMLWREVNTLRADSPASEVMRLVQLQGTENAPEAHGYLMVFPEENFGTLVVADAPVPPPGYQYQLWLIRDGKRTSGGVFSVDQDGYGAMEISSDQPLDSFPSFGITVEPQGGSPGPTGAKVLGGDS